MTQRPVIVLSDPYPLLDPGVYVALCPAADFAWARQWNKWIARLEMQPENYTGRPYAGRLCKFLGLGKNPKQPYAGPQSHFRRLLVEANGEQPARADASVDVFVGLRYEIEVVTVKEDREGKPRTPEHWYSVVRDIHVSRAGETKRTPQPSQPVPFNSSTHERGLTVKIG